MNNRAVEAFKLISTDKKVLKELLDLIEDLGWDYDRMSKSGKYTYSKIISLIDVGWKI